MNKTNVVIVSGSSCLIDTALILKMTSQYNMVRLDNVGYPFPPPQAECFFLDITSDFNMDFAFDRIRYSYGNRIVSVVHLVPPFVLYNAILSGIAIIILSIRRGSINEKYGTFDSCIV